MKTKIFYQSDLNQRTKYCNFPNFVNNKLKTIRTVIKEKIFTY